MDSLGEWASTLEGNIPSTQETIGSGEKSKKRGYPSGSTQSPGIEIWHAQPHVWYVHQTMPIIQLDVAIAVQ
jgi:hypothetical protein